MARWVVLATGPSMSQALADSVRHMPRVVVSNAFELAPDADALVSTDAAWWRHYPAAFGFAGRKFSVGCMDKRVEKVAGFQTCSNSGLLGMVVAAKLGATEIILLGFDMAGGHYFGRHPEPLPNTQPSRYEFFKTQFATWAGPPVVNCTPGSALTCFPMGRIEDYL